MNKRALNILILFVLIFASNAVFASSDNTPAGVHNDSSYESELIASASVLSAEDAMKAYVEEISAAYREVELPMVYNLPSQFSQTTIHPQKESDFFGKNNDVIPICEVAISPEDTEKKNCMSLTFDSAFINDYTFKILDILDEHDIKATFFMTYGFMSKNPDHVMEILKRGHEIGNHSTTHPDFNKISDAEIVKEVMKAHNYMQSLLGIELSLFRFPYGSYSPRTMTILKNMGYYPIQWIIDSLDWKNTGVEDILNRIRDNERLKEGAIILFHNGAKYTPDALPEIIDIIEKKNLKCVKVSDLIYHHDFNVINGKQKKVVKEEDDKQ